jgi:hypothetical protein
VSTERKAGIYSSWRRPFAGTNPTGGFTTFHAHHLRYGDTGETGGKDEQEGGREVLEEGVIGKGELKEEGEWRKEKEGKREGEIFMEG